jgi:FMN phosphatase YigB (HAD superfamily)
VFDPPVKTLLVDLDGTLVGNHQFPLSFDFVKRSLTALRKYGGWKKSVSTLLAIHKELSRTSKELTNDVRVVNLFAERMGLEQEKARLVLRGALQSIFPQLQKHFYPIPGSHDFLDWAKDRYPMVLATNPVWPPEIIHLRVQWAGVDPSIFRSITHARRMHAAKPTPDYYTEILEQEGLRAEDCLLIGDDVRMDLPATLVGIRVFIVGDSKKNPKLSKLRFPKAKAPAWSGNYRLLRDALADELPPRKGRKA